MAGKFWCVFPAALTLLICFILQLKITPKSIEIGAVHVNHGIHSDADSWEEHCKRICKKSGVPLDVKRVNVSSNPVGLEERARDARLNCFASIDADAFMMAHHANDLAETVLMRLLRGSGPRGIGAMSEVSKLPGTQVTLLRPLLSIDKETIVQEAARLGIKGVDDPGNKDLAQNRNWLRHEILPEVQKKFPGAMESLVKVSRNASEAACLLDSLAALDDGACRNNASLDRKALAELGDLRVRNWLAWSIASRGERSASTSQLSECARQICQTNKGIEAMFGSLRLVGNNGSIWWETTSDEDVIKKTNRIRIS